MRKVSSDKLEINTTELSERLMSHPLYDELQDDQSLRIFMRSHVFCVWDFQSLLKALQRRVTCVEVPWLPTADPEARRLVNEIVLDEESDEAPGGGHLSHFELYLQAMEECGADAGAIRAFIGDLRTGTHLREALVRPALPSGVADFVGTTMDIADSGQVHRIAAAFAYGREEIIPSMFRHLVNRLAEMAPQRWSTFRFYLDRHIEHDEETHGPFARALVSRLCGSEELLWTEAQETARHSLVARIQLWDDILCSVVSARKGEGG